MVVLVDAYNVIKFLLPHNREAHDAQRAWLLSQMAAYRRAKQGRVTNLIVVFDGGMFAHRQREITAGVTVVFAGRGRCADSVLIEYSERFGNKAVVITNDRELRRLCHEHHAQSMPVEPFYDLVEEVCAAREEQIIEERFADIVVTKIEQDDEPADTALDALMVVGSMTGVHKPLEEEEEKKPSRAKKKSKVARAREQLKKRLG